jgi:hypothetical protein
MRPSIIDPNQPDLATDTEWLRRYSYYGEAMKNSKYPMLCLRNAMLKTHNSQLRQTMFDKLQCEQKKRELPKPQGDCNAH